MWRRFEELEEEVAPAYSQITGDNERSAWMS